MKPGARKASGHRVWLLAFVPILLAGLARPEALASGPKPPVPSKSPVPETKFSFSSLGIPGISAAFVAAGSSMLTLHFVDDTHIQIGVDPKEAG